MRRGSPAGRWVGGRLVPWLLALHLLVIPTLAAQARSSGSPAGPPVPGSELRIYVMTMGVGEEVWERFGHNAIIVEDRSQGTSLAYNYGMFSFRQENFLLRFVQGRMLYWMAGYPAEDEVPRYRAAGRSVYRQELNLTPPQRLAVRDFLAWNSRDENRFYRYDYYRDNCSTRVRDAIDKVLGGAIAAQTQGPAAGSYRFHTLRLNANNKPLYLGLSLIEGEGADRPVTQWEEMFLPLKLRDYLRDIRIPDSTGAQIPLVAREDTLYESTAYPVPDAPPDWLPGFLGLGALLGGGFWWGGAAARRSGVARAVLQWGGTVWALVTGLAGLLMAGMWAFTDHVIAARNENVLQCTVVALALALLLPFALRDRPWATRAVRTLAWLVGGLSLLGLLLKLLPAFSQVNGQVLALFVPANVGLMMGVLGYLQGSAATRQAERGTS